MATRKEEEEELLVTEFCKQATAALENLCELDAPAEALGDIRAILLSKQIECLQTAIDSVTITSSVVASADDANWTVQDLQQALGRYGNSGADDNDNNNNSPTTLAIVAQRAAAMERMNDAARLAFCRLVLYSESLHDSAEFSNSIPRSRDLISSGVSMKHSDLLEFCGMCQTAVRLDIVIQHLRKGVPLFENLVVAAEAAVSESRTLMFPHERLERIQRMFLRALGYDPDYGTREIKRMFYNGTDESEYDEQLHATFSSMAQQMDAVLVEATAAASHDTFFANDDSVTRVVSVAYSEKLIDEVTGQEIMTVHEDAVPRPETMDGQQEDEDDSPELIAAAREQNRRDEFALARQAAVLQQEILGELLSMRDEEREVKLRSAQETVNKVLHTAMQIPAGSERVSYITSLDPATQRLMAMQKLWDGMLAANGGKPPTIRTQHPPGDTY